MSFTKVSRFNECSETHHKTVNYWNPIEKYWFSFCVNCRAIIDRWTTIRPYNHFRCPICSRGQHFPEGESRPTSCPRGCKEKGKLVEPTFVEVYPQPVWKIQDEEEERRIIRRA